MLVGRSRQLNPIREAFRLRWILRQVVACALALATTSAAAQSQTDWWGSPAVGLGPIILRSQSPLSLLRLTPTPLQPVTVPAGAWMTGVVVNWNNYLDVDPGGRFFIDAETLSTTFGFAHGINDRTDVALALPVSYRGGGILDGFIENFERWVGQVNEVRLQYPRKQYIVRIVGDDGKVYQLGNADAGWGLEDPVLSVRYQLAKGTKRKPAFLVSGGVKVPVGSRHELRSTGTADVYLALAYGQRLGRFNLYASVAGMRYGSTRIAGVDLNRHQTSFFQGLEFRKSPKTSWLLQGVVTSAGTKHFGDFAASTYEVTIGMKHVIRPGVMFEASILENLFIFDNSPDFGVHFGIVRRIGGRRAER